MAPKQPGSESDHQSPESDQTSAQQAETQDAGGPESGAPESSTETTGTEKDSSTETTATDEDSGTEQSGEDAPAETSATDTASGETSESAQEAESAGKSAEESPSEPASEAAGAEQTTKVDVGSSTQDDAGGSQDDAGPGDDATGDDSQAEAQQSAEESEQGGEAAPKKRKTGLIVGIAVALGVLVGGGGAAAYLFMGNSAQSVAQGFADVRTRDMNTLGQQVTPEDYAPFVCGKVADQMRQTYKPEQAKEQIKQMPPEMQAAFKAAKTTVTAVNENGDNAKASFEISAPGQQSEKADFALIKEDGDWKMCG